MQVDLGRAESVSGLCWQLSQRGNSCFTILVDCLRSELHSAEMFYSDEEVGTTVATAVAKR